MTAAHPCDNKTHRDTVATARELIEALCLADAPDSVLDAVRERLADATALLRDHRRPGPHIQSLRFGEMVKRMQAEGFDARRLMPWSPLIGELNPVSPPLVFTAEGMRLLGRGRIPRHYVGPEDAVHGGIVAAVFDEIMAQVIMLNGVGGFTGTLTVRYHRPVPIDTDIEITADVKRIEGRKFHTVATLHCNGELMADAKGLFIRPR